MACGGEAGFRKREFLDDESLDVGRSFRGGRELFDINRFYNN
jgi:hypothetical protein